MQTLCGKLKLIGGEDLKIWLDTEQLKQVDSDSLKHHVEQSLALLVFLSEGYLTADFCLTELRTAYKARIPIIVVCDSGVTKGTLDQEIEQFTSKAAKGGDPQGEDKATLDAMVKLRQRVLDQWHIEQKGPNNNAVSFSIGQENSPVLWWSRAFVRVALKGVFQQLLDVRSPQPGSPLKQSRRSEDPHGSPLKQLLDVRSSNPPKAESGSPLKQPQRSDDPSRTNSPRRKRLWSRAAVGVALKGVFQQLLISSNSPKAEHGSSNPLKRGSLVEPSERSERERSLPKLLFHDELLHLRKLQQISRSVSLFVSREYPPDRSDELERAFRQAGTNLGIEVSISPSRNDTADQHSVLLLYPGVFGTKELKNLLIRETKGKSDKQTRGRKADTRTHDTNTPAPFLLYSTDMSADMSEYRQEGTRILGRLATQVFTPMWSAWPEVSSLQTVAAEEQLRKLSRPAKGTPDRASSQTVEHGVRDVTRERWKVLASSVKLASSIQRRFSRALLGGGARSRVGVQYVPEP